MKNKLLTTFLTFCPTLLLAKTEAPSAPAQGQNLIQTVVMIFIALLFFYFILWRPEKKRKKFLEEQRSNLRKGDKVTAIGIVATVDEIREHTVILKNIDGSKIEVISEAINEVIKPETKIIETESTGE